MMAYNTIEDIPQTPMLKKITILSSMGIMMDGYTLTVFSYALLYLIKVMALTSYEISIMGISSILGVFAGSIIFGKMADIYGRRYIYVYDLIAVSIFIFLTGFSTNYVNFSIFQFLVGLGIGADYPISSSIQAEFSPKKVRGKYLLINIFSFSIGSIIFLFVAVPLVLFTGVNAWRFMYIIGAIFPILVLYSRKKMPESPYWIQHKFGKNAGERARLEMEKYTGYRINKIPELEVGGSKIRDVLKGKYLVYSIFISVAWFSYDIVSYGIWTYSPLIFSTEITSYYADLYIVFTGMAESIPVFIGFLIAIYYVDKIGRKSLLIIGFLGSFIALIIFFFMNIYMVVGLIMTFSAFGIVHFFHNLGPSPMTYAYPVEIFPTRIRGTAMGFATSVSRLGSILAVFSFPIIDALYGLKTIVIYFAVFELIGLIITIKYAPETKNKSLT
ncbi:MULTISPECIES: MFS transporter [Acidiplasma]|jgi:putative MFS transporter|uniref:MFS transporter n=4 Tax=Acidiplasma TaxID=507753 RepID=A0A0Q0S120_9ARCH|nr:MULTISPECIES: MFS transporter [Acidiplasma]KQB36749.1 MFS transporter [Acidiplasma aeolicum]KQB36770.1 MFS transporter [Acidiplasma cupricumulans]WMT54589.1 MAG: MFS transporter [Acidiplasma sp.]